MILFINKYRLVCLLVSEHVSKGLKADTTIACIKKETMLICNKMAPRIVDCVL